MAPCHWVGGGVDFIYLFIFRGGLAGERKKGKETLCEKQCVRETLIGCLSHAPTGNLARNPGMCPDWNQTSEWPFSLQASAQSTEPHQLEYCWLFKRVVTPFTCFWLGNRYKVGNITKLWQQFFKPAWIWEIKISRNSFIFLLSFIIYAIILDPTLSPFVPSPDFPLPSPRQSHIIVHVNGSYIYVIWLILPLSFIHFSPPTPALLYYR